ncbi:PH domain-containing protein [Arthrobacter psychrolactophilus]
MSTPPFEQEPAFTTDDADTWHRVHPVSPLVRGWVAVAAIIVIFGRNSLESVFSEGWDGGKSLTGGPPALFIAAVVGAAVVIFGVAFFLSWRFTRYQVTDEHVHINSGIVFRQQRRARIDRVQAIDVVQPLVARAFGLAELKFEVADGGKSALKLSFLKIGEAKRLRAAILARAAGVVVNPEAPGEVQEAPETQVLALSPGRIIGAVFLGSTTIVAVGIMAATALTVVWSGKPGILVGAVPLFIGIVAGYWKNITRDYNFRIAMSPDGVRLHYGLLETRSQTIPPGRVQAVGITQGPLWRIFGWYRVHVNVAGYGADASEHGSRTVACFPWAPWTRSWPCWAWSSQILASRTPSRSLAPGCAGPADAHGFIHSPRSARWIDPLAWRRNAFRATETALLCRHGVIFRSLQVVPHERTQSLGLRQGPSWPRWDSWTLSYIPRRAPSARSCITCH